MKKADWVTVVAAAALLVPAMARADGSAATPRRPFLHVEVREGGGREESVKINLPLAVASEALQTLQEDLDEHGPFRLDHSELPISDLRRMWRSMCDAGDTEFVAVREDGRTVRLYRQGDNVFVKVDDRDTNEIVRLQVPLVVMDALLAGDGETLNLPAAVDALARCGTGEILRIEDRSDFIRVWID
jgi:hypothetical protein